MSDNAKYKHLFIAYASKDQAAHHTLLSHLNLLQKEIPIRIWSEADLMPGAEIQKETQAELQRADIVLLLVSKDSLNSEAYINIQSQVRASTTFVPVLLRACMWESDPFLKDLQPLPKNRQYISQADDEDAAYTKIAQEIKKMVLGKAEDRPFVPPVNQSSFWKKAALVSLLLIGGIWLVLSLLNSENKPLVVIPEPEPPITSEPLSAKYGTPIFTTDTSLFKILIIRFEDNLNEDDDTYCIGRSILENFIQLKTKDLPIHAIYADTIASPKYPDEAERIQKYHNADVLIYGLANEIQENCTAANVCFRHVVANTIMANLGTSKDKRIKHDDEYEKMSHRDIAKGKLSVDEQSMENWVTGLVALKKDDKETYFEEIEKMAEDIAHLTREEQASRFYHQANIYRYSGDYEKAIASYIKAIELKPDYASAYYNRGVSYDELKAYKKAISDYNKAIELKPDDAEAYNNRGISYAELKEYKKAILDFDKAIELKPDYAKAYYNRGIFYDELKAYKKAITSYTKAIELKPDDAEAYIGRAATYIHSDEYEKAITDSKKAIKLDSHPYGYFNLIAAYALNNLTLIIFSLILIIALFMGWRKYHKSKK